MPRLEKTTATLAKVANVANVVGSGAQQLTNDATKGLNDTVATLGNVQDALNSKVGGGRKRYIKSPKGRRLVRKGPRGGKYIIYNGKKRYLTKK